MKTPARTITTILGGAALFLATTGMAGAQETAPGTPRKQAQKQARNADHSGQGQTRGAQNQTGATRKLGSGGGAGKQGVRPQDATGNGSPGRQGASAAPGQGGTNGRDSKAGKGTSGTRGPSRGALTRSRTRNPNGARTCTGSSVRSRRGSGGSGGRRR